MGLEQDLAQKVVELYLHAAALKAEKNFLLNTI